MSDAYLEHSPEDQKDILQQLQHGLADRNLFSKRIYGCAGRCRHYLRYLMLTQWLLKGVLLHPRFTVLSKG